MGNGCMAEISCTILNIFRPYKGIDVLKLPFLEELYKKTFVVPYVDRTVKGTYEERKKYSIIKEDRAFFH